MKNEQTKTRRPVIRGKNTPRNLPKAFRGSGNGILVKSVLNGRKAPSFAGAYENRNTEEQE